MPGHPLAKRGAPHGHLPPFGRPTGAYGHRLPHWPPTGHLLATYWPSGEAPTGHRTGGAFARPSPDWPKGREGEPMATRAPIPSPADRGPSDGEGAKAGLHTPDWPKGGGGGFSRAKGADAMLPVCLTPLLGTPTPTD